MSGHINLTLNSKQFSEIDFFLHNCESNVWQIDLSIDSAKMSEHS